MKIIDKNIDAGKAFDWGKTSEDYPIFIPESIYKYFEITYQEEYEISIPFTKETWNGRMKACRGIGASLSANEIAEWEKEHLLLLDRIASEYFDIKHYAAIMELKSV